MKISISTKHLAQRTISIDPIRGINGDSPPFMDWRFCYGRIRRWLVENKCRCVVTSQGVVVLLQNGQETRPLKKGQIWLKKIDSLPPVFKATRKQASELFRWVIRGFFEWSHWQYDGQFCMRDYALAGEKDEEIRKFLKDSDEELTRLQQP